MMPAMLLAELVPMAGATHGAVHLAMITGGEVAVVAIVFGTMTGMFYPVLRALARRMEGRPSSTLPLQGVEERLDRIERSVEAIAVEVERISEGQRFVTKLLAERPAPQLPAAKQ